TPAPEGSTITVYYSSGLIEVPEVLGESQAVAEARLEDAGFKVRQVEQESADVPRGTVIEQTPTAGERRQRGSTVTIAISGGKPQVTVPGGLIGSQVAQAQAMLESQGFNVDTVEDPRSSEAPGTVTAVDPAEGSSVEAGSTVTLYYTPALVPVPDVVQQNEDDAEAALSQAGFRVRTMKQRTSDVPPGTVIAQDPGAGEQLPQGSTVTIVVAG
ncbi:PASTA domain-containing protein, partial [Actinopolymorpha sp. B11F2]|uniref:PASTA domain-containing protein n=1 Tax=Actinopolymorpha sp. B11F2 TaxID=3160862 RepID=UPI0032E51070